MTLKLAMAAVFLIALAGQLFAAVGISDYEGLFVTVGKTCYKEPFEVAVRTAVGAADGGRAYLYSMNAPRHLVSEITLDSRGKATFTPKPIGKYEIAAQYGQYKSGSAQFEIRKCYNMEAPTNPPEPVQKATVVPMNGMAQFYDNGVSRSFELVNNEGKVSTRITLRYTPPNYVQDVALVETVPMEIANSQRMVGFESAYPAYISTEAPYALEWRIGKMKAGQGATIVYVVDREITAQMAPLFEKPSINDKPREMNATKANTAVQKPRQPSASTEAALVAPNLPDLPLAGIGLLLAGIVIATAIYLLINRK